MLIRRFRPGDSADIRPSEITSESVYFERRKLLQAALAAGVAGIGAVIMGEWTGLHEGDQVQRTGRVLWKHGDGRYVSGIATDRALYLSMGSMLSRWARMMYGARMADHTSQASLPWRRALFTMRAAAIHAPVMLPSDT